MNTQNRAYRLLHHNHLEGKVILSTVSGILTTEPEMVGVFDRSVPSCDIITTKSYQVVQTFGHREPVVCCTEEGSYGNFVGLRNPGMEKVYPELEALVRKPEGMRAILNISLSANCVENFITLVKKFDSLADMLELNFSCPHAAAGFGASIGSDPEIASSYVRQICEAYPERKALLIIKLTPNVSDIGAIAKAVIASGADGVAAINTVGPVVHTDKASGRSIFNTWEGGRGGLSGEAVHQRALECIAQIRKAIGPEPVVLGMGGVTTAENVRAMMKAGADSVGLGSVLARLEMADYENYFKALKDGASVDGLLIRGNRMLYEKHTVTAVHRYGDEMVLLTLDGRLDCHPGQFAFLWIPDVGEKPFSVANNSPLQFLVKRRGQFTEHCFNLEVGAEIYMRGLYGKPMNITRSDRALLIAGGSGVAVLPLIAERLSALGVSMDMRIGMVKEVSPCDRPLAENLAGFGQVSYVADAGKPGRVLDTIEASDISGDVRVYIVGPGKMMDSAARRLVSLGMSEDRIQMSMERLTLCGIGMCGECVCAGKLACKEGTFYSFDELEENGVKL